MHHEQDMRKMGGLKKYMPITYWTSLVGSLALIGFPGFAGFFSKDAIIEAVHNADRFGAGFAYFAVVLGVFITALYSFRMFFLVFHGEERMDKHTKEHLHETAPVVTFPLIALAIPSVIIGAIGIGTMVYGDFFKDAIFIKAANNHFGDYHGVIGFITHGLTQLPVYLAFAGIATAYYLYIVRTDIPAMIKEKFAFIHAILDDKYGFDRFNQWFFAGNARSLGNLLWRIGDIKLIDGLMVNGTAYSVGKFAKIARRFQTGYLYQYAFVMMIGLFFFLLWAIV
jgi:NADH-quinone oxidoreductase subunit L